MDQDQRTYELIDGYLKEDLKREDLDKVKYLLRTDPQFAKQLEIQKAIIEEIQESRRLELKAMLSEKGHVGYMKNMWGSRWMLASAAVIVAFIGMYFVIKYYVPQGNQLSERTSDAVTEEKVEVPEGNQVEVLDTIQSEVIENQTDSASTEIPAELEEEDSNLEEPAVEEDAEETPDSDMSRLREESDKLAADEDVEVQTDHMLAERTLSVEVLGLSAPVKRDDVTSTTTRNSETVEEVVAEKKKSGLFKDRKKNQDKEQSTDDLGYENKAETETSKVPVVVNTKSVKIELWKSIVNFKGYLWDRETLILYDISESELLEFKEYNSILYMKRGNDYYTIKKSSKFESYVKLADPKLIAVLNNN